MAEIITAHTLKTLSRWIFSRISIKSTSNLATVRSTVFEYLISLNRLFNLLLFQDWGAYYHIFDFEYPTSAHEFLVRGVAPNWAVAVL